MNESARRDGERADEALERLYREHLEGLIADFYGTIRSRADMQPFPPGMLVGLLTFPNSGTSWFLRLAQAATGIQNHTAYEGESLKTSGRPSRGAYLLGSPTARPPAEGEPSLVKSHVDNYDENARGPHSALTLRRTARIWARSVPPACCRHIRLVRNPIDNLRARFHLYRKKNEGSKEPPLTFRQYFRNDLPRYLWWHAYCNGVVDSQPLMSVYYHQLTNPQVAAPILFKALRFAGYDVGERDAQRALSSTPSIYSHGNLPVHLAHYTEDDILWIAGEMKSWLGAYARVSFLTRGLKRMLRKNPA